MKKTLIALTVLFTANAFATGTGDVHALSATQKDAAIQAVRSEANAAMNGKQAALDAYNQNRNPQTTAALQGIENSMRTAQARIDAIQAAPLAQQQQDPAGHPVNITVGVATPVSTVPSSVQNIAGPVVNPQFAADDVQGHAGTEHSHAAARHNNAQSTRNNGQANANASRGAGHNNAGGQNHY